MEDNAVREEALDEELQEKPAEPKEAPVRWYRYVLFALGMLILCFVLLILCGYIINWRQAATQPADAVAEGIPQKEAESKRKNLEKKFNQLAPKGAYIVIDTGRNMLSLRKGVEVLRQAVVSCGSGNILEDPNGSRKWVFDTPRGAFAVKTKVRDPSWIKPDWAFIEDGEAIPKDPNKRVEEGVLGEYALGFGDGYFIHGTLYTRLLGRNVTHGCVRVGDEDLEAIFKTVSTGTPVFIF